MSRFSWPVRFSSTAAYWPARPICERNSRGVLRRRRARDAGGAGVGREQRREDSHRGGLAGAVRAEDAEHAAFGRGEVDAAKGLHVAERLLEAFNFDHGHGTHRGVTLAMCFRGDGTGNPTFMIGFLIAGLIIGALARLLIPGRQKIGLLWTLALGVVGSLIGGTIANLIGSGDIWELNFIGFIAAVVASVALLTVAEGRSVGSGGDSAPAARLVLLRAARGLHARAAVQLELAQPDGVRRDLDALVLAQELE